jgi:hypothetical protein
MYHNLCKPFALRQESHARLFLMLRLVRQTPRAVCVRSFTQKAASPAPKAAPEGATAAGLPPTGGE